MKTYLADIFPKILNYTQKLDDLTLLTNKHWVSIDNIWINKTVYIFRDNNELLISTNGKVEKAKWEYLGNRSLLIEKNDEIYLFKNGFFDQNIFALKVDSSEEYAVFVNENNYGGDLNTIEKVVDFLKRKYLDSKLKSHLKATTGREFNPYPKKIRELTTEEKKIHEQQIEKAKQHLLIWLIMFVIAIFAAAAAYTWEPEYFLYKDHRAEDIKEKQIANKKMEIEN